MPKSSFFCLALLFGVGMASLQAAEPEIIKTTVPISLEDNYHGSSLVVHFPMVKIGKKSEDWSPTGKAEEAMKEFLNGIKAGDANRVLPFVKYNEGMGTADQAKQFIDFYTQNFDVQHTTVDGIIPVDGREMLILSFPSKDPGSPDKIACSWLPFYKTNGAYAFNFSGDAPVEAFLLEDIIKPLRNHPNLFLPLPNPDALKYSLPISAPPSPVTLKFAGFSCNLAITNLAEKSTNDVAQFYLDAYRLLTNATLDSVSEFAGKNTPGTADRWKTEASKWTPQKFKDLSDEVKTRKIKFILDANPVYIVFFESYRARHHEYVVRTEKGLKLTGLFSDNFLDHVLNSIDVVKTMKQK